MPSFIIEGGHRLKGEITPQGAKNEALQVICATLLTSDAVSLENVPDIVDVTLNLDFLDYSPGSADAAANGACLPYDYVEEEAQRMEFHRRLAETSTLPAVRKLRAELADRYGRLPKAAARLVKVAEFRVLLAKAGYSRLDVRNGRGMFYKEGARDVDFVAHVEGNTAERKLASLVKALLEHSARAS